MCLRDCFDSSHLRNTCDQEKAQSCIRYDTSSEMNCKGRMIVRSLLQSWPFRMRTNVAIRVKRPTTDVWHRAIGLNAAISKRNMPMQRVRNPSRRARRSSRRSRPSSRTAMHQRTMGTRTSCRRMPDLHEKLLVYVLGRLVQRRRRRFHTR